MATSSILVITDTTESVEFRLVKLLGGNDATSPFVSTCEECISTANAPRLLRTVLDYRPAWDVLFQLDSYIPCGTTDGKLEVDGRSVGVFTLLVALLDRISDPIESSMLGRQLADAVESYSGTKTDDDETSKKVEFLCSLYNQRSSPKEKCWFLGRILFTVGQSSVEEVQLGLLPGRGTTFGKILECNHLTGLIEHDFMKTKDQEKGLDNGDMRLLYRIAAEALGRVVDLCKSKRETLDKDIVVAVKVRQTYLLKILNTYSSVSEVDEEALEAAKAAAIGAIRDPLTLYTEQSGMMVLPPIISLESGPVTKSLHYLLQIFQEGKLEDFQAFQTQHDATLTSWGLSTLDCTRNIRLLSLCSLATEYEEVPYDVITSTLQVPLDDVENWVIAAVSSGLLSAKMDQLEQVVKVERCIVRRFGVQQWKMLQNRLDNWKTNVSGVLQVLKQGQTGPQQSVS